MKHFALLLLLPGICLLGCIATALAQEEDTKRQKIGRAPYAITAPQFECNSFLQSMQSIDEWHISVLFNTFGTDYSCLKKVLKNPKLKTLQVHLINENCIKHGRCGSYEFASFAKNKRHYNRLWKKKSQKMQKKLTRYVKPLQKFLKQNLSQDVECLISPGLESQLSNPAATQLIAATRPLFPQCKMVWNPLRRARNLLNADYVENHGKRKRPISPCIMNTDGTDINFPTRKSVEKINFEQGTNGSKTWLDAGSRLASYVDKFSYCEYMFLWVREDNCLPDRSFRDPRRRDCRDARKTNSLVAQELQSLMTP